MGGSRSAQVVLTPRSTILISSSFPSDASSSELLRIRVLAISMDGSPDPQHLVFAPNGNPVQFYLWGTNEPDSYDGLSAGQRKKLTQQIEVSAHCVSYMHHGTACNHRRRMAYICLAVA